MKIIDNLKHWFNNLSLKNKLSIIIIEMALFMVIIGLFGFYLSYKENQSLLFQYQNRLISIKWLNSAWGNIRENEAALYKIILLPEQRIKKKLASEIEERGHIWLIELNNYAVIALHDPYEDVVLPSLQKKVVKYIKLRNKSVELAVNDQKEEFLDTYLSALPLLDSITETIKELSEYNDKMATKEYKESVKNAQFSYFIIFFIVVFSLITAIFLGLLIISNITHSIKLLSDKMKEVAQGNLDAEPIEIKYADEIGILSERFNSMTDNLRRAILKEKVAREKEDFLRKEIEEQRKTFLSTLTHDLRSPLIAEQKALEAILSGNVGSSLKDFEEYLEDMHKTNEDLLEIVNNLLAANYYESETIELELEENNIKDVIEKAIKTIKPLAKENNTDIIINIQDNLPKTKINIHEINRVLINLISNAIKHNPKDTNIIISATQENHAIKISIKDNGKGIPDEEKENIFKKYPSRKRKIGSGLGLYLSKQIINAHNGRIWFETEHDKGTTFSFVLPIN